MDYRLALSEVEAELRRTRTLLKMANDTIQTMRQTSDRDLVTILRLVARTVRPGTDALSTTKDEP